MLLERNSTTFPLAKYTILEQATTQCASDVEGNTQYEEARYKYHLKVHLGKLSPYIGYEKPNDLSF